jgi:hypothetical protein
MTSNISTISTLRISTAKRTQAHNLNEALWKQLHFADVERFTYKSADDWDVDAFL